MNIKRVIAAAALTVVPLTAFSAALAASTTPQGAPVITAAVPAQVTSEGAQYVDTALNRVNELRSNLDLQPVARYQELDAVAQDWSEQQIVADNTNHRPDLTSVCPSGWTTGSENAARRTAGGDTGAQIFDQWLNSPGRYKNMTDLNVNSIGIGFAQISDGKQYAARNFAVYNISNLTLTPSTTTTANTTTTMTKSNVPSKMTDTSPTDTTVPSPTPTPEITPPTPSTEMTTPVPTAPPTSETITPVSTPSVPVITVTTQTITTTGAPAKPSAAPAVAAPRITPTRPALTATGPSIIVVITAAGLLGTGAIFIMRRCQAS